MTASTGAPKGRPGTITPETIQRVLMLDSQGLKQIEIAPIVGHGQPTVSAILRDHRPVQPVTVRSTQEESCGCSTRTIYEPAQRADQRHDYDAWVSYVINYCTWHSLFKSHPYTPYRLEQA